MYRIGKLGQFRQTLQKVRFCTATPPPGEGAKASKFSMGSLFKSVTFQRCIRVARVVFVSIAIYQAGYQNGMIHFAQDPKAVEEELIRFALGVDQKAKIADHIHSDYSAVHKRVSSIGSRIIMAARDYCAKQLKDATDKLSDPKLVGADRTVAEENVEMWQQAVSRMNGNWTFVIRKDQQVNAFVTGFCPRKVFVYEGLLNRLQLTDDELALIIGHEISHVILGHVIEHTPRYAMILGTQLVLMSLVDPIGLGSFLFDMVVSNFGDFIEASYSRQSEYDADALGLVLSSMACFDIRAGASTHDKLGEASSHHSPSLWDSHPTSLERKVKLMDLADDHEKERLTNPLYRKYHQDCVATQAAWRTSVFGKK